MSNKRSFRNGMGIAQIMATLLIVFPTLAFSIMILLDYWNVMQADYKLKLLANLAAEFTITRDDLRDFSDGAGGNGTDYQQFLNRANRLCPGNTTLVAGVIGNAPSPGEIDITVQHQYNGLYLKNKTLSTQMNVYSYKDQNLSVTLTCQ